MIPHDVKRFIDRSERRLISSAEAGSLSSLRRALAEFGKLVEAWIEVAPRRLAPPSWPALTRFDDRTADPLEINLYEVADAAARSGETSSAALLAAQLLSLSMKCFDSDQPLLGERLLDHTVYLYRRCAPHEALADAVETALDSALHSLKWRSRRAAEIDDAGRRFGLALVHDAIRYGRVQAATDAAQRLFERHPPQYQRWRTPVRDDRDSLLAYTAIMLAGWSLHVQRNASGSEAVLDAIRNAAKAACKVAVGAVPSDPAVILALWELYRDGGDPEPEVDRRLGIARWDVQEWKLRYRPGVPETYWRDTSWAQLGLRASLLCAPEHVRPSYVELFAKPASRFTWKPDEERKALQASWLAEELGVPQYNAKERIEAAMKIISQRAAEADRKYAQTVRNAPLSKARSAQLEEEARQALRDPRRWRGVLAELGVGSSEPTLCPIPCRYGFDLPRECLIDGDVGSLGMGSQLAEGGGRRSEIALIVAVERLVLPTVQIEHLADLPKLLRAARRGLIAANFVPNAVILPDAERFAAALFDKPIWQVEGQGRFDGVVLGIWEDLTVLRCPYIDASSALVIDTTKLLTKLPDLDESSAVTISFEERDEGTAPEPAAKAENDTPPSPLDMRVLVTLEAKPLIGIANPEAARGIDLAQSNGAYRLDEEQKIYHRPNCSEIGERPLKPQVWMPREMKPCPKCQPDRWDLEEKWGAASKA